LIEVAVHLRCNECWIVRSRAFEAGARGAAVRTLQSACFATHETLRPDLIDRARAPRMREVELAGLG